MTYCEFSFDLDFNGLLEHLFSTVLLGVDSPPEIHAKLKVEKSTSGQIFSEIYFSFCQD